MTKYKNMTNLDVLEQYTFALKNVERQPEIKEALADLGYDEAVIAEGREVLARTKEAYNFKEKESDETSEAYQNFLDKKEELEIIYTLHRKKAKVVFRKDPLTLDKLGLNTGLSRTYSRWIANVSQFYLKLNADTVLQEKLQRLRITAEDLSASQTLVAEVEDAKAIHQQEKGESQNATKEKNRAFDSLDDWMSEFYAVARIGLEENPQLLESIGKFVRS